MSTSCGLAVLGALARRMEIKCKTAGPAQGCFWGSAPAQDATPYLDGEVSPPLPIASNHYSEWDALNMRRHVMLYDPVRREGGNIYINVSWVGGEGLTEGRREGGKVVGRGLQPCSNSGWQRLVSCFSPSLGALS